MRRVGWLLACSLAVSCTCGPPPGDDAGVRDASVDADAGAVEPTTDAGSPADAGTTDAGPSDGGPTDAGLTDAGSADAGASDGGTADAGSCGDGIVDALRGEQCDVAIPQGAGACPTTCDAGVCENATLTGLACQAVCTTTPITQPIPQDRCCPPGAHSVIDDDCPTVCGNGLLEAGEACDVGVDAGPGLCPTSCDDSNACTIDSLDGGGTCGATCERTVIVARVGGDGCCPTGATALDDSDCAAVCGNAVVEPIEACDVAIDGGAGSCPTGCADAGPCAPTTLVDAGTCSATCQTTAITQPMPGDACCPPGAHANNDGDCAPVCGNRVIEAGEACDDGNQDPNDACNACTLRAAAAFRQTDRDLRDPHVFVNFLGCRDITDTPLVGYSVNGEMQTRIQTDGDIDGLLDDSLVVVFRAAAFQSAPSTVEIHQSPCSTPFPSPICQRSPASVPAVTTTASPMTSAQCLGVIPGTVRPYVPALTSTGAPCFVTAPFSLTLSLGGIPLTLRDARLAATFVGTPATALTSGLIVGFISETDANATILPSTQPLVGGQRLSSLLPGGLGTCAAHDDRDSNGGVRGWWVYLNFTAARVPWIDN